MEPNRDALRVSAIIPAYNEADRIGSVLAVLVSYPKFREVIIVDDGSKDRTAEVVRPFLSSPHVRYLRNEKNLGKGGSMDRAVRESTGDSIFFCDADIVGLTHENLDAIVDPVLAGEVEMFIGMPNRRSYAFRYVLTFTPLFSGERALTKRLWEMLPPSYKQRFRIEAGLNFFAKYHGKGFAFTVFRNFHQTVKEKKYGFLDGLRQRIGMFWDIFRAELRLHFLDVPKTVRSRRFAFTAFFEGLVGFVLGAAVLLAGFFGPAEFSERFGLGFPGRVASTGIRVLVAVGGILLFGHAVILALSVRRAIKLLRISPMRFRRLPKF